MTAEPTHLPASPLPWYRLWWLALTRPSVATFRHIAAQSENHAWLAPTWAFASAALSNFLVGLYWSLSADPTDGPPLAAAFVDGDPWILAVVRVALTLVISAIAGLAAGLAVPALGTLLDGLAQRLGGQGDKAALAVCLGAIWAPLVALLALGIVIPAILVGVAALVLVYSGILTTRALQAVYGLPARTAALAAGGVAVPLFLVFLFNRWL